MNAECPGNPPRPNGLKCLWHPAGSSHPYGASSVDESKLQRIQVSPQRDATKSATSSTDYYRNEDWPTCMGHCSNGLCALKWDHPVCCSVSPLAENPAESDRGKSGCTYSDPSDAAEVQGKRYAGWAAPDIFCWN